MAFNEEKLEQAIIDLLGQQGYPYVPGATIERAPEDVLIREDLETYLRKRYTPDGITAGEIRSITQKLNNYSAADLYDSNKAIMKLVSDGFVLKREDHKKKDLYIQLVDYSQLPEVRQPPDEELESVDASVREPKAGYKSSGNIIKVVNQLEIVGTEKRIPDAILYINGLPLVVFEFKSATREEVNVHEAYVQLTTRYKRDIPELFKYNAFCVISDGANSKMGSFFAPYEFYYAWRRIEKHENAEVKGIDSLHTLLQGLFDPHRLLEVIRHFIHFPDKSHREEKILCRYPQYYAATRLYDNIIQHRRPEGDGKGGTYFGATGCGKSYTMLFLTRLLMRSVALESPTIVVITDRTDLDSQLSEQFVIAKRYIGDQHVMSVQSREHLRELLQGRKSGGVFLTTIHKFTEDTELLTERSNVICISDEAHRSQVNLDQKVTWSEKHGVRRTYGFAKYLHDSLPNATYVGFTGTPIDATLDVFGDVVDSYTMTESVKDEITVPIVYEGRAAKVALDNSKLKEIEEYYEQCAEEGASEYAIEESKKASANMGMILGDPDRIRAVAEDFVQHYETRVSEGSTLCGKAMFVCANRQIAWQLYQEVAALKPEWTEIKACEEGSALTDQEQKEIKPMARMNLVATRGKDDDDALYNLLGTKEYRKELDRQYKKPKSNFKIAIVVDMWLTGFDVPMLDTMYIDKPIQRHNLIQTISRVNRKLEGKTKGLVVDYIGIKKQMNLALAHYNKADSQNFEEIEQSAIVVKDHLDLLHKLFHKFDSKPFFTGTPVEQLHCLNMASEFVQLTQELEKRFMHLVKRMKAAYDICSGSELLTNSERDYVHFYLAVRSIVAKLTKGDAPDTAQMNARVREMITEALKADGVEEIIKMGEGGDGEVDLFDDDYLSRIEKIKLPNTKIKLLQQLLTKAISDFRKVNRAKGIDFSKQLQSLVEKYNERDDANIYRGEVADDFVDNIIDRYMDLIQQLKTEIGSYADLDIDLEEKAFYDILNSLMHKYDFSYPDEKLKDLAKAVKAVVDDKAKYMDWSKRDDIKYELKADLIVLLDEYGYPPIDRDEVYKEIFEQAENFKAYRGIKVE
ncbi:type I restriction endonuclease subunit R [Marinimicrobium sp. ABcell2]|uniref:type I restriction endonuclease subunit R n=1 Tax=Marinimicrobium sp. ABcell2 TaxID=3069751 RepID=UPI0027B38E34|nr:HsdR family type I site-specific deoxyribonuclease [Marinimicrobium sp. ABcell2]MDQ2077787.1 HsdR family type I site-specific deoxyribonuclease [Marinimicrobium sp. ABcell2]